MLLDATCPFPESSKFRQGSVGIVNIGRCPLVYEPPENLTQQTDLSCIASNIEAFLPAFLQPPRESQALPNTTLEHSPHNASQCHVSSCTNELLSLSLILLDLVTTKPNHLGIRTLRTSQQAVSLASRPQGMQSRRIEASFGQHLKEF